MKNYGLKIFATLMIAASIGGCASGALGKLMTPNTVLIAQLAFDVSVGAVCGPDTAVGKAKAASLKLVATELLAIDQGSMVPLAALETSLQAKLATLNLPPADLMAAQMLMIVINQTISNLVQTSAAPAAAAASSGTAPSTTPATTMTAQVAVATVLQQIINAASAYGV